VNGVEQREGADFTVEGDRLLFSRELAKEGRLGPWRWLMMLLGVHGTYGRNDSVDLQYEAGGQTRLVTGLDLEPLAGQSPESG
jgi:hypothetical protein